MIKKVCTGFFVGFFAVSYGLAAGPVPVLGQVVANTVYVDGLKMPSGTTVFDKTVVKTTQDPASVHLKNGQVLQIHRNSSAYLEGQDTGEVQVAVRSGTVSYRAAGGEVMTAPPKSGVVFAADPQQTRPVTGSQRGLRIILLESAEAGQKVIKVNDAARLDPKQAIMLQSPDGKSQEIHYIEAINGNNVTLTANLQSSYEANSAIIQNAAVLKSAMGRGAVVVGAAGGISAGAAVAGVAAGAAVAAGVSTAVVVGAVVGVAAIAGGVVAANSGDDDPPVITSP